MLGRSKSNTNKDINKSEISGLSKSKISYS